MKNFKSCNLSSILKLSSNCKSILLTILFIVSLILLLIINFYINGTESKEKNEKSYLHILNNSNIDSILNISKEKLVLINFELPNSIPCQNLDTVYRQLAKKFKDSIIFCKVNIDSSKKITKNYKISSIPSLKFIHNKKTKKSTVGYLKNSEIIYLIDRIVSNERINEKKVINPQQKN